VINFEVAEQEFHRRFKENPREKQIDNAKLIAGSPMYFYCKGCGIPTETLPENYIFSPARYCDGCRVLAEHGMLDRLMREACETPK